MLECGIFFTCFVFYHCPWLWLELKYINYFLFNPNQGGLASHDRIILWGVICYKILVICCKCLSLWQFFFFLTTNDKHKKNWRISILINGLCYLLSTYIDILFKHFCTKKYKDFIQNIVLSLFLFVISTKWET